MDELNRVNMHNINEEKQGILCVACGKVNKIGSKFCGVCGSLLILQEEKRADEIEAFGAIDENIEPRPEQVIVEEKQGHSVKYVEPASVFAEGLPSWDMLPPQVMVRRH